MENKELKERFIDERTGIEYVRQGDYYIPNLVLPKQKKILEKEVLHEILLLQIYWEEHII